MLPGRPGPEGHLHPGPVPGPGRGGRQRHLGPGLGRPRPGRAGPGRVRRAVRRGARTGHGVRRRLERPPGRGGQRRPHGLVRRPGLGPARHARGGVPLRPGHHAAGVRGAAHRVHGHGATPGRGRRARRRRRGRPRGGERLSVAAAGQQRLGHRLGAVRRWRRHAPGQPPLPVGGRAAVLGGAPHRPGRARRLRGAAVGPARPGRRLHRGHRPGPTRCPPATGSPPTSWSWCPGSRPPTWWTATRSRDDLPGRDGAGAAARRIAATDLPDPVEHALRPDARLPRRRLDRRNGPSPTATPTSTTTSSSPSTWPCSGPRTWTTCRPHRRSTRPCRCSTPSPPTPTGRSGTRTPPPPPTCPRRRSTAYEERLATDPITKLAAESRAVLLDGSDLP